MLLKYATTRLKLIDINYSNYVLDLNKNRKNVSFFSNASSSLLSTTSSLIQPKSTSSILSAVASSITGVQAASEKEYFVDKTMEALISQMNANRAQRLVVILTGLKKDSYGLIELNNDLDEYYKAGLVINAIQSISSTAQAKSQAESKSLDEVKIYDAKNQDEASTEIEKWLNNGVRINDPCRNKFLDDYLKKAIPVDTPNQFSFLYNTSYAAKRAEFQAKFAEGEKACLKV